MQPSHRAHNEGVCELAYGTVTSFATLRPGIAMEVNEELWDQPIRGYTSVRFLNARQEFFDVNDESMVDQVVHVVVVDRSAELRAKESIGEDVGFYFE
jgi:hypothetical protein